MLASALTLDDLDGLELRAATVHCDLQGLQHNNLGSLGIDLATILSAVPEQLLELTQTMTVQDDGAASIADDQIPTLALAVVLGHGALINETATSLAARYCDNPLASLLNTRHLEPPC